MSQEAQQSTLIAEGTRVAGSYEIKGVIASGASAVVYRASHLLLQKDIALKVLCGFGSTNESRIRRFHQEAKTISLLSHPHIVKVLAFGELDDGQPFIALELLDGITLADKIKNNGPLGLAEFNNIFLQLLEALSYAHQARVLHRDLKPENIVLLSGDNDSLEAKLADFGIAKILEEDAQIGESTTSSIFRGTAAYMSPEQCRKEQLDFRSDVYSIACVMYEALSGKPPFSGETNLELMYKQSNAQAAKLSDIAAVPASYSKMVERCLAKDPNQRFASIDELRNCLKQLSPSESEREKPESRSVVLIAMSAVLVLGVLFAAMLPISKHLSKYKERIIIQANESKPSPNLFYEALIKGGKEAIDHRDTLELQQWITAFLEKLRRDGVLNKATTSVTTLDVERMGEYTRFTQVIQTYKSNFELAYRIAAKRKETLAHMEPKVLADKQTAIDTAEKSEVEALIHLGRFDEAFALIDNQLKRERPWEGANGWRLYFTAMKAEALLRSNNWRNSIEILEDLLGRYEQLPRAVVRDFHLCMNSYVNLAQAYVMIHADEKARATLSRCLSHIQKFPERNTKTGMAGLLARIARTYLMLGDDDRAKEQLDNAESFVKEGRFVNRQAQVQILCLKGILAVKKHQFGEANSLYTKAIKLAGACGDKQLAACYSGKLYTTLRVNSKADAAQVAPELLSFSDTEYKSLVQGIILSVGLRHCAVALSEAGDKENASRISKLDLFLRKRGDFVGQKEEGEQPAHPH